MTQTRFEHEVRDIDAQPGRQTHRQIHMARLDLLMVYFFILILVLRYRHHACQVT